jgi:type IV pilus assembly protein PilA
MNAVIKMNSGHPLSIKQKGQQGLVLIELLLVLMIIGIIAMVAIPMYQEYAVRAKVSEGLSLATPAKFAVNETYNSESIVADQSATGFVSPPATPNVSSVTIANDGSGEVHVAFTADAGSGTIILRPSFNPGSAIDWSCTGGTLAERYRPAECR